MLLYTNRKTCQTRPTILICPTKILLGFVCLEMCANYDIKFKLLLFFNLCMIETASLPPLSAIFGSLMIMALMQYFGRKAALIMISIPYILGFLLMGFTYFFRHKSTLFIGGILTGLVVGSSTPAAQIYV